MSSTSDPLLVRAAEQSLAADGAIACFSSNLLLRCLNADRAPQLKASVMRLIGLLRTRLLIPTLLLLLVGFCASARGQKCLEYGPTVLLTGTLRSHVFPGPPNYESIKRGDRKETAIVLILAARACTTGIAPRGYNVPETRIREMQLVVTDDAHWKTVRRLMGKRAVVTGTLFHAHTGHHRTKVLVDVANIRAAA